VILKRKFQCPISHANSQTTSTMGRAKITATAAESSRRKVQSRQVWRCGSSR